MTLLQAAAQFLAFARRHWSALAFGAALLAISNFGQTHYLALFTLPLQQAAGLGSGEMGALYSVATLLSAVALMAGGRLVDAVPLRTLVLALGAMLAAAACLLAWGGGALLLGLGLLLTRFAGQSMLVHVAVTTTARRFPEHSGKAVAVTLLGFSVVSALLPPLALWCIATMGWRSSLLAGAFVVIFAAMATATGTLGTAGGQASEPPVQSEPSVPASVMATGPGPHGLTAILLAPAFLCTTAILAGVIFHQQRVALAKGWSGTELAQWLFLLGAVQSVFIVIGGPLIDRYGGRRLAAFYLLPVMAALLAFGLVDNAWVAPVFFLLVAMTTGLDLSLQTRILLEVYGPARLARIRGIVEGVRTAMTGIAPWAMGLLLDAGVAVNTLALALAGFAAFASTLLVAGRGWLWSTRADPTSGSTTV